MHSYDVTRGSYYLTVPFDCREDLEVDDLDFGQFYVRTEKSVLSERYHDELEVVSQTNAALHEQLRRGAWTILTELGKCDNEQFAVLSNKQVFHWHSGVAYGVLDSTASDETIYQVLSDPITDVRFVAKVSAMSADSDLLIDAVTDNLVLTASTIFDSMGYLLWWPVNDLGP